MDTVSIFIGDLSYFCIEADLVRLCEQFGTVTSAIVRRGRHGDTLHYAFVKMASADAHETIRRLQGMKFMGRPIRYVRRAPPPPLCVSLCPSPRRRVGLNVPAPQIANDQRSLWAQIYVSFQTRSVSPPPARLCVRPPSHPEPSVVSRHRCACRSTRSSSTRCSRG